jgi:hypothetical protein
MDEEISIDNSAFVFFTEIDGEEKLGGSHYDFDLLCNIAEMFMRHNKERDFLFMSICKKDNNGEIKEWIRWAKGSIIPLFDLRNG